MRGTSSTFSGKIIGKHGEVEYTFRVKVEKQR